MKGIGDHFFNICCLFPNASESNNRRKCISKMQKFFRLLKILALVFIETTRTHAHFLVTIGGRGRVSHPPRKAGSPSASDIEGLRRGKLVGQGSDGRQRESGGKAKYAHRQFIIELL